MGWKELMGVKFWGINNLIYLKVNPINDLIVLVTFINSFMGGMDFAYTAKNRF